jgi:hypothetical protein
MPIQILGNEIFTKQLTNDTLTLDTDDGIGVISVLCTTSTPGTILGTGVVNGVSSAAVDVAENNTITISAIGRSLGPLTITAPLNCTLIIVANKS